MRREKREVLGTYATGEVGARSVETIDGASYVRCHGARLLGEMPGEKVLVMEIGRAAAGL